MASPSIASTAVSAVSRREPGILPGVRIHAAARALLVATLFAAPLAYGAVLPWAWASLTVLASVLLLLWAVGCVRKGSVKIQWSPLYLPAGLFLLLGVIQYLGNLTVDRVGTREALLKLATDLVFFFLAGQLWANSSEKGLLTFGFAVAVYTLLLSVSMILQYFSGQEFNYFNYWKTHSPSGAFGPYVNHNHYAGLMELLIPLAAAYALSHHGGGSKRGLWGLAIVPPVASALLSGSRGGFIALLFEIGIVGVVLVRSSPVSGRRSLMSLGALAVVAAATLFFWIDPGNVSKHLAQVANLTITADPSYTTRKQVALDSINVVHRHPWLGAGLGTFETAYARYQTIPTDLRWDHAHDDFIEAAVEAGLAGAILLLVALAIFLGSAFGDLNHKLHHEADWMRFGATVGCCGLLVHSLVDFNLRNPATAAWFAVCAGIAVGQVTSSHRKGTTTHGLVN